MFTIYSALQNIWLSPFFILYNTDMRSQLLTDQLPGEHQGLQSTHLAQLL